MSEKDYSSLVTEGLEYTDMGMENALNIPIDDKTYCVVSKDEKKLRLFIQNKKMIFKDVFNGIEVYSMTQYPSNRPPVDGLALLCSSEYERQFVILSNNLISSVLEKENDFDPQAWCDDWKSVFGNVYSEPKVYDTLAELIALGFCHTLEEPDWEGPYGGRHDILCKSFDCEVKSTLRRNGPLVISVSDLQMKPGDKPLKLFVCSMEQASNGKFSIDSVEKALVSMGFDRTLMDDGLERAGIRTTKLRKESYNILKILVFDVDDTFPVLDESKYDGGSYPDRIVDVRYSLDLKGLENAKYAVSLEGNTIDFGKLDDE